MRREIQDGRFSKINYDDAIYIYDNEQTNVQKRLIMYTIFCLLLLHSLIIKLIFVLRNSSNNYFLCQIFLPSFSTKPPIITHSLQQSITDSYLLSYTSYSFNDNILSDNLLIISIIQSDMILSKVIIQAVAVKAIIHPINLN